MATSNAKPPNAPAAPTARPVPTAPTAPVAPVAPAAPATPAAKPTTARAVIPTLGSAVALPSAIKTGTIRVDYLIKDGVIDWSRNMWPRDDARIASLAADMAVNGYLQSKPLGLDDEGNVVIGHHRSEAVLALFRDGSWVPNTEIPVTYYPKMTADQRRAVQAHDNLTGRVAERAHIAQLVFELMKAHWTAARVGDTLAASSMVKTRDGGAADYSSISILRGAWAGLTARAQDLWLHNPDVNERKIYNLRADNGRIPDAVVIPILLGQRQASGDKKPISSKKAIAGIDEIMKRYSPDSDGGTILWAVKSYINGEEDADAILLALDEAGIVPDVAIEAE